MQYETAVHGTAAAGLEVKARAVVPVQGHIIRAPVEVVPKGFAQRPSGDGGVSDLPDNIRSGNSVDVRLRILRAVQVADRFSRIHQGCEHFARQLYTLAEALQGSIRVFGEPIERDVEPVIVIVDADVVAAVGIIEGSGIAAENLFHPVPQDQEPTAASVIAAVRGNRDEVTVC